MKEKSDDYEPANPVVRWGGSLENHNFPPPEATNTHNLFNSHEWVGSKIVI